MFSAEGSRINKRTPARIFGCFTWNQVERYGAVEFFLYRNSFGVVPRPQNGSVLSLRQVVKLTAFLANEVILLIAQMFGTLPFRVIPDRKSNIVQGTLHGFIRGNPGIVFQRNIKAIFGAFAQDIDMAAIEHDLVFTHCVPSVLTTTLLLVVLWRFLLFCAWVLCTRVIGTAIALAWSLQLRL